jgi:hypothetical protein
MIDEHELCKRTFEFAVDVAKLCVRLQERGAVVARNAIWLRVIGATDPPLQKELQPFLQEANEFIAMLTTSLKNARLSQSRGTQNPQ